MHGISRHSQQGLPCTEKSISMTEGCYTNEGTQRINMRSLFSPTTITLYLATESNAASSFETGFTYQNEYMYFFFLSFFRFRGLHCTVNVQHPLQISNNAFIFCNPFTIGGLCCILEIQYRGESHFIGLL